MFFCLFVCFVFFPPLLQAAASQGEEKSNRWAHYGSVRRHQRLEFSVPLVLLFGGVRGSRRLLLLEAAAEEGERRVHHVVAAPGGGDFVPFVWENLDGGKEERQLGSAFIQPLGQTALASSQTRQQHNRTHFQAILLFIFGIHHS